MHRRSSPAPGSDGAQAPPVAVRPAGRFRSRLVTAFVLVAAISGGVLAVTSYVLTEAYRFRSFAAQAEDEAALSLYAAPTDLSISDFEDVLAEYQARGGFDTIAVDGDVVFSSRADLGRGDLPADVVGSLGSGELRTTEATVDGRPYLVVAGRRAGGTSELFFYFSERELRESLVQTRNTLALGWVTAVIAATIVGHVVARRTLRPVRIAAESARSLAEGLLHVDIDGASADEFDVWSRSFDQMAAALATKLADLERAAERERRFTSDVAHELRTPLTGMVSAAELLEDGLDELPADRRRPAKLLIDDVRRLQALVVELLELARFDAGQEVVNLEPLDVGEALAAVVRPWDARSKVELDVEEGLCVLADRVRFRHVVRNLVSNAVRHGAAPVTVRAARARGRVAIEVLDRGPGVPERERERVFERFAKGDSARSGGGSGLGLAIALQQARLQGGAVELTDRPDGGARFTLLLDPCPAAGDQTVTVLRASGNADVAATGDARP